eukprot:g6665.t1
MLEQVEDSMDCSSPSTDRQKTTSKSAEELVLYPNSKPVRGLITGFYKATETFRIDFAVNKALRIRMDTGFIQGSIFESKEYSCRCEFHLKDEISDSRGVTEYLDAKLRQYECRNGKVGYMLGKIVKSDWGDDGVFLGIISEYAKGNRFKIVYMDGDDEWGVFSTEQDFKVFRLEDGGDRLIQWFDLNIKELRAAGEDIKIKKSTTLKHHTPTPVKKPSTRVQESKDKPSSEMQNKKKNKKAIFSGAFTSAFLESSKIEDNNTPLSDVDDLVAKKQTNGDKSTLLTKAEDRLELADKAPPQGSIKRTHVQAEDNQRKPSPIKRTKIKNQVTLFTSLTFHIVYQNEVTMETEVIQEEPPAGATQSSDVMDIKQQEKTPCHLLQVEAKMEFVSPPPLITEESRSTSGSLSTSLTKASPRVLSPTMSRKPVSYSSVEIGLEMQNLISELENLTQSKDKIVHATTTATAVARYGGAKRVIDALFDQIKEPVGEERKISLFYLCDSILQFAAKDKQRTEAGKSAGETIMFLELVQGRLTELVEHLAHDYECYKKLKRVLGLWKERKVLSCEALDCALAKVEALSTQHAQSIEDDTFKEQGKTVLYVRRSDGPECSRVVLSKTFSTMGSLNEVMKLPNTLQNLTVKKYSRSDWDAIDNEIQRQEFANSRTPRDTFLPSRSRGQTRGKESLSFRKEFEIMPPLPQCSPMDIDDPNFIPPLPPGSPPDDDPNFVPPLPSSPPPPIPKTQHHSSHEDYATMHHPLRDRDYSPMKPWERPHAEGRYYHDMYPNQPPLPRGNPPPPPQSLPPHLVNHGYHYQPSWPPSHHRSHHDQGLFLD